MGAFVEIRVNCHEFDFKGRLPMNALGFPLWSSSVSGLSCNLILALHAHAHPAFVEQLLGRSVS